jgi:hypothetical protein
METSTTTESALLEWASGVDARIGSLTRRLTNVQHALFAVGIVLSFHFLGRCLCPPRRPAKPYRH